MQKRNKIILIVLGGLAVAVVAIYSGSAELFQGRIFTNSKPLPAYNENRCYDSDGGKNYDEKGTIYGKMLVRNSKTQFTDYCDGDTLIEYYCEGKSVKSEEYACESGCGSEACEKTTNVNNALDTLVIVDTDYYDITEQDVKDFFAVVEELWLEPKTGIGFSLSKIVFVSLDEECPQYLGSCDTGGWMDDDFPYFDKYLPEYVVILTEDGTALQGGYAGDVYYYWLDPQMGSFYNPNSEHEFCTEFPPFYGNNYSVAKALINYKHKFGRCGYDQTGTQIISNVSGNGECKNQNGITCVTKNGYQMCPDLVDDFFAQDVLYFSAKSIVHELLHSYGQNGALDHFETYVCNDAMGDEMQAIEAAGVSEPFETLLQEYAGMCPNTWDNFKDIKKSCD